MSIFMPVFGSTKRSRPCGVADEQLLVHLPIAGIGKLEMSRSPDDTSEPAWVKWCSAWVFSVVVELHGVGRAAAGPVSQVSGVAEHRGHRDKTGDGLYTRSCGNSSDFSPSGVQIAQHFTDVVVGSHHLERHDRLQHGGRRLVSGLPEPGTPGDLEGGMV